jgi:hypothetical protein
MIVQGQQGSPRALYYDGRPVEELTNEELERLIVAKQGR